MPCTILLTIWFTNHFGVREIFAGARPVLVLFEDKFTETIYIVCFKKKCLLTMYLIGICELFEGYRRKEFVNAGNFCSEISLIEVHFNKRNLKKCHSFVVLFQFA
jgi:hypothetical protein